METETCWKFRWFWAWQDDHEEEWLGSMSRAGWHLTKFGYPGVYFFRKGEPKNYIYRLDFQTSRMKDRDAYLQLFHDAGWEHLGNMSAWEYFRKEAKPGEAPEIFTDPESKIQKYLRVLRFLVIFCPIIVIINSTMWWHLPEGGAVGTVLICITLSILLLYIVGTLGIILRIGELKMAVRK
jgi:hypothetical protein